MKSTSISMKVYPLMQEQPLVLSKVVWYVGLLELSNVYFRIRFISDTLCPRGGIWVVSQILQTRMT